MQSRTYRYFSGQPLYGFGYGLSYTTFAYSNLHGPATSVSAGQLVIVQGNLKNTGAVAGDEVAQLYLTQPGVQTPLRVLAGFTARPSGAGESSVLTFVIDPRVLGQIDATGNRIILPGDYTVSLGGSQPGPATPTAKFTITGKAELPE